MVIPHDEVAGLGAGFAAQIGLPPLSSASCQIEAKGRVDQPETRISLRWRDSDYSEVRPRRTGAFLSYGQNDWRLGRAIYDLLEAIDGFNETVGEEPMNRIAVWGPVQDALGEITGQDVSTDDYLKSLTIYQAGSFALDVQETASGPDFLPVLMARSKRQLDQDDNAAPEDGDAEPSTEDLRDESADALLPPDLQNGFSKVRFANDRSVSSAYVLGRSTFVVLDPGLKEALTVVKEARSLPGAERRKFVKNPRSYLAASLENEADAAAYFVETKQYSDRVTGLGLWEPPSLPWLARFKTAWMPEGLKLSVNGQELTITEPIESLAQRIQEAKDNQERLVDVNGQPIQVDALETAIEDVVRREEEKEKDLAGTKGPDAEPTEKSRKDRNVLLIENNLENPNYVLGLSPRKPAIGEDVGFGSRVCSDPKPHQVEGIDWLISTWKAGWPGVLLADDMGLGKTYQALAFLAWRRANLQARGQDRSALNAPALIVAPTALLRTWINEAEQHLGDDVLGERVEAFGEGLRYLKMKKGPGWTPENALDVGRLREAGWILVTYQTLATYHRAFARVGYSVAVFDEMQRIKSPDTISAHAAKTLSADFVLGLTGTPVENRLEDLWCIMDRIAPGYLGDLRGFNKEYGDATSEQLARLKGQLDCADAGIPGVLKRRMKEDILEGLPTKTFETYKAEMPKAQSRAYVEAVEAAKALSASRATMLEAIHRFRGISLHPDLQADIDPGDLEAFEAWVDQSARVRLCMNILEKIKDRNEKVLLFVESKAVQRTMATGLAMTFDLPSEPMIINGDVPGEKRQSMVDEFQARPNGFDVMILSPRAAGVGLTITAANHVVHLSRWWNPAVEDQCNDRVYRIGQDKPVTIHVPMSIHPQFGDVSFDLKLDNLLDRKRALSGHLLAPPESESDVEELFEGVMGS